MSPPPRANPQPSKFVFKDASGKATSVDVIQSYQSTKIGRPFATADRQASIQNRCGAAAPIAEERAHAHSSMATPARSKGGPPCIRRDQLPPEDRIRERGGSGISQQLWLPKAAGERSVSSAGGFGPVDNANRAAGHVEIRTNNGFVSDFRLETPSRRPLLGVFVKS